MAAPSSSSLLEKLTPELRVNIYSHIFGTSQVIKPSNSDTALGIRKDSSDTLSFSHAPPAEEVQLHTSILTTSKIIFLEVILVLYAEHTIRGTTLDFHLLLQNADFAEHARRIEIADCIGHFQMDRFHSVLRRLQILPRACSLVILSDCLGLVADIMNPGSNHITVVKFARIAQLGDVTCTDIGRYQLHGMFRKFTFVNRRLTQMWPHVRSTPDDYNACDDVVDVMNDWHTRCNTSNWVAWATQTSLRCWVGMHDLLLQTAISGELEELRTSHMPHKQAVFKLIQLYAKTTRPFNYTATDLTEGFIDSSNLENWLLRHLKAGDDHDTLSWATEYLSLIIATHNIITLSGRREKRKPMKSSWPEVDGNLATIKYHTMHQQLALEGQIDPLYHCHPRNPGKLMDRETSHRCLNRFRHITRGILTHEQRTSYASIDALELRQLMYLCMAMQKSRLGPPARVDQHEEWSANLLRRYLMVPETWRDSDFSDVPAEDLREVVETVLLVLATDEGREECDIPRHVHTLPPQDSTTSSSTLLRDSTGRCLSEHGESIQLLQAQAR